MNTHRCPIWLALALALAACSGGSGQAPPDGATAPDGATLDAAPAVDAAGSDPSGATGRAATAICGALFRCCEDDVTDYFAPYRANERLAPFLDRLPPMATLDQASCRAVVEDMLEVVYLGEWVRAVQAGEVEYDAAAFGACTAALDGATCGAGARAALWDATCFGLAPPGGGAEQRSFVRRTRGVGEACSPVRDGIGSVFYGSCDPSAAFCCFTDPARPGCQFPFTADGSARPGVCRAIAATGDACSAAPPFQLCATGASCDASSATCVAPTVADLAIGATCVDAGYNLLGTCVSSWCDVLGTRRCEPLRDDGTACTGADECRSGLCQTTCRPNDVCTGTAPPVDAGMPDGPMPTDAGVPDARVVDAPPADGERCASALDLIAASSPSPLAGYAHRIASGFGASNDYNPLSTGGLPPQCSIVYDARGKERVYAVTLQPGDRLRLRAELPDGRQAAIYLLDTCPGGSWPDLDGTGACGSNEYNAGFCGAIGCEAAALDIRYPATLGGQPTAPATFWVVVDQVGGDASTGFVLDWQRVTI